MRFAETLVSPNAALNRIWQLCKADASRRYLQFTANAAAGVTYTMFPGRNPNTGISFSASSAPFEMYDGKHFGLEREAWYWDFGAGGIGTNNVYVVEAFADESAPGPPLGMVDFAANLATVYKPSPAAAAVDAALRRRFRDLLASNPVFKGV